MFFTFFIIQFFLLMVCFVCGQNAKIDNLKNRWLWLFVVCFTLIEGLRFGRGIDYNVYYRIYSMHQAGLYEDGKALLFDGLCSVLVALDMPYQTLIVICSGIIALGAMLWLRHYPQVMVISLPLFYCVALPTTENLFRWYTAFSFILMGLYGLICGKKRQFVILSAVAVGFHIMVLPVAVLFYFLNSLKKNVLSPSIAIFLYLVISIVWSTDFMLRFMPLANYILSRLSSYQGYADNLSQWLDGSYHGNVETTFARQMLNLIMFSYLLIVGNRVVQKDKGLLLYYNILAIGIVLYPAMHTIELADRFNQLLIFFQCLIGAYCFFYVFKDGSLRRKYSVFSLLVLIILSQNLYKYLTPGNKYYTYYIWDDISRRGSFPDEYLYDYNKK